MLRKKLDLKNFDELRQEAAHVYYKLVTEFDYKDKINANEARAAIYALQSIAMILKMKVDEDLLAKLRKIYNEQNGGGTAENLTKDLPILTAEDLKGE
ncbi:hypothetical protein [Acetivibrio straminisolvens]|jgi:hypothetical protein|uniref:hypothetical protein n=1 Tax=Acetivibrio straminisolvens TaxID=253314 RepID=UPI00223E9BF4|nr:hypothetical protein [Acetivibrio straminisolvens]